MNFRLIYPKDLRRVLRTESAVLIDVRTREQYKKGHWPGARNFPYEELERWEKMIPGHQLVIFYCDHGGNSMQLAHRFGMQGYKVASVVGGYPSMKGYM